MAEKTAEASNSFSMKVFAKLIGNEDNVVISPWSLFNALSMTYVGARENTALQMSTVLGFEDLKKETRSKSEGSGEPLERQIFESLEDLLKSLEQIASSEGGRIDFVNATEQARCEINSWVENTTNAKIKELIPPGILTALTRMVLTSAVYFKGSWLHPFKVKDTTRKSFYISANEKVRVDMMYMNRRKDLRYYEADQFQVLALPYVGDRLTMNIILPNEGLSFTELLRLVKRKLDRCVRPPKCRESVKIYLPKFKFDFNSEFVKVLNDLGASDMFNENVADFSGITKECDRLVVGSIIHKAFIEVNEVGTEAVAATSVEIMERCLPTVFNANHPFLFLICDKETKLILFMGKVEDPSRAK
eukprot:Seg659.5 transcript_id=Seg659.5/GoldUCD/mRNA.D3Y31 product="Serpin B6" protein_id=Seg659.5/GoldUCD/D3Y31